MPTGQLIDFTYDLSQQKQNLDAYADDAELLARINTGRSDVSFSFIALGNLIAATTPDKIT